MFITLMLTPLLTPDALAQLPDAATEQMADTLDDAVLHLESEEQPFASTHQAHLLVSRIA